MKLNYRKWMLCGLLAATALIGTGNLLAQENGNGGGRGEPGAGGENGGQRRQRGNWDPAQMQQRMMERLQDEMGFTNDTEWSAVEPLVQKVVQAQFAMRTSGLGGMGRMMGRNRGGTNGNQNGRPPGGGLFGQQTPLPEADALQKALDDNAPSGQVKDLLAKYKAAAKVRHDKQQADLETAQANLRAVLSSKQEATATLMGLLD